VLAFANNINTVEGGTHVTGFRAALTSSLTTGPGAPAVLKDSDATCPAKTCARGLTAVISVKLTDPQLEGQTKGQARACRGQGAGPDRRYRTASGSISTRTLPMAGGSSRSA
jgi:DNA gyrase subunit B